MNISQLGEKKSPVHLRAPIKCRGTKQGTSGMLQFNLPRRLHKPLPPKYHPRWQGSVLRSACVHMHAHTYSILHNLYKIDCVLSAIKPNPRKTTFSLSCFFFFHFFCSSYISISNLPSDMKLRGNGTPPAQLISTDFSLAVGPWGRPVSFFGDTPWFLKWELICTFA